MEEVIEVVRPMLKVHEGLRLKPYKCTADKTTIGYGRNLEDVGISEAEAEAMLNADILECISDLKTMPYWNDLTVNRKAALTDLRFNLGPAGFRGFRRMNSALDAGNYAVAAAELLDSRYAKQVGRRANTLAGMLLEG